MNIQKQLEQMLSKALRSLAAARRNLEAGDYDFASSRAYYAAFYAIEGILLTKELSFSKHSAVLSAFNLHFVKEQVFPKEFSKMLIRLFRERQIGDYSFEELITQDGAEQDIGAANTIIEAIKTYLKNHSLLPGSH